MTKIFIVRVVPTRGDDGILSKAFNSRAAAIEGIRANEAEYHAECAPLEEGEEWSFDLYEYEKDLEGIVAKVDTGDAEYFVYELEM